MNYAIETINLTKKYGRLRAVDRLNLQIPLGSIFALLGPNGAGKTTTLKMLMNILSPQAGSAKVLGVDSRRLGYRDFQRIGYVSENQEIPEWMTVRELLNYCRPLYPSWDQVFCDQLVTQFDLPMTQKLKHLSRGVRMKAALVSSLAYRPKLVVLDEPFSGLDPFIRQEFLDGILRLTETAEWTVIISSHDIDEVERLANLVGILNNGKMEMMQPAEELQNRFKRIAITLGSEINALPALPPSWFLVEHQGKVVSFIESEYQEGLTEKKIQETFLDIHHQQNFSLSLREIFLVLSKHWRSNPR